MPRILLAGMNKYPNQFSRYLESKGCETVRVSGDPGGHIPTDCEAVIIAKCQISHEKFYKTKELYKDLDKPVFITDFGMTPIRERLEAFLKKFPKPAPEPFWHGDTSMARAFKEAAPTPPPAAPIETKVEPKANIVVPKRERRVATPKPDKAVKLQLNETGLADRIWKVLDLEVSINQKASLIWSLINHEPIENQIVIRKTDEGLQFFSTNPISKTERPLITLTQVQAVAIVQHLSQVEDYATDPNV